MTTIQKVGKGILLVVGAPVVMIGVLVAIYGTLFAGIVQLIRNHGKVGEYSQPIPAESAEAILEPNMVPHLAR